MKKAVIAARLPYPMEVKKGETVQWCACGLSQNQPWCDGSHRGTDFVPVTFTARRDQIVFFCGCKHSKRGEICDGSHARLERS